LLLLELGHYIQAGLYRTENDLKSNGFTSVEVQEAIIITNHGWKSPRQELGLKN